jgi:hypothetical protein
VGERELQILLIKYEVAASWWARKISVGWLQYLSGRYFAWKVKRKFKHFKFHEQWRQGLAPKTEVSYTNLGKVTIRRPHEDFPEESPILE